MTTADRPAEFGDVFPRASPDDAVAPDRLRAYANIKRWYEWWQASPVFRAAAVLEPQRTASDHGLDLTDEEASALPCACEADGERTLVDTIQGYETLVSNLRHRTRDGPPPTTDERFARWRRRQFERCELELGRSMAWRVSMAPVAIELSVGCSQRCWFCAVAAQPLDAVYRHDRANAALFCEVAAALHHVCGPVMGHGFLYWATDPFDNPDYERFAQDWERQTGRWPYTSTAMPIRHLERLRPLVARSCGDNFYSLQVSILSVPVLRRFFEEFSPIETLGVSTSIHTRHSLQPVADAGWARTTADDRRRARIVTPNAPYTPACVSGFVVNMVERSVKMITPCRPDERWPEGHRVLGEERFDTGDEFAVALDRLIDANAVVPRSDDAIVRFRPGLEYQPALDGFDLGARTHWLRIRARPGVEAIGTAVARHGRITVDDALDAAVESGVERAAARETIDWLDTLAVFDDLDGTDGEQLVPVAVTHAWPAAPDR